jgi:chromate reductase
MTQLCLLGLSGSLRRASNSTAVLRGLQESLARRALLNIFPLHGLSLYNEDDDAAHAPESVRALRSAIFLDQRSVAIEPFSHVGVA